MDSNVRFEVFLDKEKWRTLDQHIRCMDVEMESDVAKAHEQSQTLKRELRELLESQFNIRTVTESLSRWATNELFAGSVCAIDGTRSVYPLLSGVRCRIGVVAVSYKGNRTESVVFVSEQQVNPPEANPIGILKRRMTENTVISSMVVGAIMGYMERSIALERPEKWKLLNGPLIPYELRTGLGELQALRPCLELSRRIIQTRTVAGVIGTSSHLELTSVGLALAPGEYVKIHSLKKDLDEYLHGTQGTGIGARSEAKFSARDHAMFEEFLNECGDQIDVGIFRAGARPYLFQASRECFDEVAALLMVDASSQPLRSYPLLVDYADSLCSRLFSSGDFRRQMEMKLSKTGGFDTELPEEFFRRR